MRQAPFSPKFGAEVDQASALAAPELVVPPASALTSSGVSNWFTQYAVLAHRFQNPTRKEYRYVNLYIGTSSGNIQVGVGSITRSGTNVSITPVKDSGIIASPGTGGQRIDLGAFHLNPGEYGLYLWCDNTTITVPAGIVTGFQGARWAFSATLTNTGVPQGSATALGTTAARFVTGLTLESPS